ncbi:MAG: hypothetical protein IT374_19815 [Polyangiaceae bacterium]|nr:hypothetical protein [Polyangiaceae bacterium]
MSDFSTAGVASFALTPTYAVASIGISFALETKSSTPLQKCVLPDGPMDSRFAAAVFRGRHCQRRQRHDRLLGEPA